MKNQQNLKADLGKEQGKAKPKVSSMQADMGKRKKTITEAYEKWEKKEEDPTLDK